MAVARVSEIIGSSTTSGEDAFHNALDRANKTVLGLTGLEITKINAGIDETSGKIQEFGSP